MSNNIHTKKILFYFLSVVLLLNLYSQTLQLPEGILGINIGQKYKDLLAIYQLKKTKSEKEYIKKYVVVYLEQLDNIETCIYTFQSTICEIKVTYKEYFFTEADFENIYDKAITLYGKPKQVYLENKGQQIEEVFVWENEKLYYKFIKISDYQNNFKNFSISITDKTVEQKIKNLSPIKKLYYKIF